MFTWSYFFSKKNGAGAGGGTINPQALVLMIWRRVLGAAWPGKTVGDLAYEGNNAGLASVLMICIAVGFACVISLVLVVGLVGVGMYMTTWAVLILALLVFSAPVRH